MTFREKLKKETILIDGAFGTYIQALGLGKKDFGLHPGCMEYVAVTRPELVEKVHADYFDAGADAVETNTFGGSALKLGEYGLSAQVHDINRRAAEIACKAAKSFSTPSRKRYVIGSMGPTGKLPSSTDPSLGDISYKELKDIFFEQSSGLIAGGVDSLLIETGQDLLEMKAAVAGAKEAIKISGKDIVLMAQFTLGNNGRMLLGTQVQAAMMSLGYLGVDVIGMNCGAGPLEMEGAIKYLSENSPVAISFVPNAGLPVERGGKAYYELGGEEMGRIMAEFVERYRIDVVGGCCGTDPSHIKAISEQMKQTKKRAVNFGMFLSSVYQGFDLSKMEKPIIVGERINTQGSRNMKEMLINEDFDGIVELGKEQVKKGAKILDVCAVLTERKTEKRDAVTIFRRLSESVDVPLMIDSTDPDVIEEALCNYSGTAVINSVNLEDGGRKARRIFTAAKEHGAFVVALVIGKNGMAKKLEDKMALAGELYDMGVKEYGLLPHQLVFDMLTFSLGTGEVEYADSAVNTCKAIKDVKEKYKGVQTTLGVSNVSFGLPKQGRKILNAVFLHHAVLSGLDMAIVNPGEMLEYEGIPQRERSLAEALLFNTSKDALNDFVEYFVVKKEEPKKPGVVQEVLSVEEMIKKSIVERNRSVIIPLLDEALKKYRPEEIINGILLDAMRIVGEKFESGEFVLPYVLQAAETMRKGIDHLERFIEKNKGAAHGKLVLATVFGDVHDIGKNLVKMIIENNGFNVVDMGKQVPAEDIVKKVKDEKADVIGLSALLVATARYMHECVQALSDAGINVPVIIGGAPTSEAFAKDIAVLGDGVYRGGVFHAKDAFGSLKLMQLLTDPGEKRKMMDKYYGQFDGQRAPEGTPVKEENKDTRRYKRAADAPVAPFYGVRTVVNPPIDEVFTRVDKNMLFTISWGSAIKDKAKKEELIKNEYEPLFEDLKNECIRKNWLEAKAVYGYFKCRREGNELQVLAGDAKESETITFTPSEKGTVLTEYFKPDGEDVVIFQAVTIGNKINEIIKEFDDKKEYSKVLYLHGLGVNLTEAFASYMHDRIRKELKLKPEQGKRYSPGFPLWKDLEDQKKIFRLLDVEKRIGLKLTSSCQIVPEQSTTAMVVYNELAEY